MRVCYNGRMNNKISCLLNIIQNKQQRGWDYEIYYQRKKHHSISGTQNSR